MNAYGSPQLTLALRRFLGKDMALECLGTLDASTCAHYKALGRATLCFHLWHLLLLFNMMPRCFPNGTFKPGITCF
jgi:uncharacterized membrane protein